MSKKQFSFRLRDSDDELSNFITSLGKQTKSESEVIRQLLLYAYRHYKAEHHQKEKMEQIQREIVEIRSLQDQYHSELLKQFKSAAFATQNISNNGEQEEENDQIAQETAAALLSGFGNEI